MIYQNFFLNVSLMIVLGCIVNFFPNISVAQELYTPISFDGTESLSYAPDSRFDFGDSGTIEFVVKLPCMPKKWRIFRSKKEKEKDLIGRYSIIANASGDSIRFAVLVNSSFSRIGLYNGDTFESVPYNLGDDKEHHVALITSDSITTIVIDNVKVGSINIGYGVASALPLHIGSLDGSILGFVGSMYMARLWDKPLTISELRHEQIKTYGLPSNNDGLVAYSKFKESKPRFIFNKEQVFWSGLVGGKGDLNDQITDLDVRGIKVWANNQGIQKLGFGIDKQTPSGETKKVTKVIPPLGTVSGVSEEYTLEDDEHLIGIMGTYDDNSIQSLYFLTDLAYNVSPPYGNHSNKNVRQFSVRIPEGTSLASIYYTYSKEGKLTGLSLGYKEDDVSRYLDLGMWRFAATFGGVEPIRDDILVSNDPKKRGIDTMRDNSIHLHGNYTTHPVFRLQLDTKTKEIILTGDDLKDSIRTRTPFFGSFGTLKTESLLKGPGYIRLRKDKSGDYHFEDDLYLTFQSTDRFVIKEGTTLLKAGAYFRVKEPPLFQDSDTDKEQWGATFTLDQRPRKIEYNFKGFSIAFLDPINYQLTTGTNRNVFKWPAENSHEYYFTSAGKIIPNGLIYKGDREAMDQARTSMIGSNREHTDAWNFNLGLNIGIPGASFGGSMSHEQSTSTMSKSEESHSLTLAHEIKYALVLDKSLIQLDDDFRQAVLQLRDAMIFPYTTDTDSLIFDFITEFGTHYPYAVTYGGMAYLTKRWSRYELEMAQSSGTEASVQASGTVEGITMGGNVGGGVSNSSGSGSTSEHSAYRMGTLGGELSMGAEGGGWSLPEGSEVPVFLDLRPITELLSPIFFEDPLIWTGLRSMVDLSLISYESIHQDTITRTWIQDTPRDELAPINAIYSTPDNGDIIKVETKIHPSKSRYDYLVKEGLVSICLKVDITGAEEEDGWWKGLGLNEKEPQIQGKQKDGPQYVDIHVGKGPQEVYGWKAKELGSHRLALQFEGGLDFSTLAGYQVTFTWTKD